MESSGQLFLFISNVPNTFSGKINYLKMPNKKYKEKRTIPSLKYMHW